MFIKTREPNIYEQIMQQVGVAMQDGLFVETIYLTEQEHQDLAEFLNLNMPQPVYTTFMNSNMLHQYDVKIGKPETEPEPDKQKSVTKSEKQDLLKPYKPAAKPVAKPLAKPQAKPKSKPVTKPSNLMF